MRARRNDANKSALKEAWIKIGGSWLDIVPEHGGEPDALVGILSDDCLVEVKNPTQPASKRKLRANQVEWHGKWQGRPVKTVETFRDLAALFRLNRDY